MCMPSKIITLFHPTLAPLLAEHSETVIDGEYIVVFKDELGDDESKGVRWPASYRRWKVIHG